MESSNHLPNKDSDTVSVTPVEFSNYQCEINPGFNDFLKKSGFEDFGFKFNVVTILGSQSSGKSHLLNSLFNASFQTMDASKGHSQTTKGIWGSLVLSKDTSMNATVVFDSEGTDSRERGEGRLTFEHRSSLFCLALSDVVIVNIWYNSMGNLTGSNYGLLKTVVEANLELVDTNNEENYKTVLFFCVRDWSPSLSPLNVVKDYVLNNYMSSIWNEISKPARFENLGVESLFEIRVFGLSNAVTQSESFEMDVKEVKKTWNSLKPREYSRRVPSDGFFVYSKNVWKTIIEQNHLDIPTQKEMLSSYRCSEIKTMILESLTNALPELKEKDFSEYLMGLLKKVENQYFSQASRYDPVVSKKVGKELLEQVCRKFQPFFESALGDYVKKLAVESSSLLDKEFSVNSSGKELKVSNARPYTVWPNFSKKCEELQKKQTEKLSHHLSSFKVTFKSTVSFEFEFEYQPLKDHLNLLVSSEFEVLRSRHLELLKQQLDSMCNSCFALVKNNMMDRSLNEDQFWDYFDELFDETHKNCVDQLTTSYVGLVKGATRTEFEQLSLVLLLKATQSNFEELQNNLEQLLLERFDKFFNYQEFKGELIPTEWHKQSAQELNNRYKESKEDALTLLQVLKTTKTKKLPSFDANYVKKNQYFYSTLEGPVSDKYSSPLTEQFTIELTNSCSKKFMEMYKNAQVVQNAGTSVSSWRNIPPVFWLVLLVLGWNELRAAFRVLLKFYILIPLLIVSYFTFSYSANKLLGPKANEYVKPVRDKALSLLTALFAWFVRTLHMIASKSSSFKQQTKNLKMAKKGNKNRDSDDEYVGKTVTKSSHSIYKHREPMDINLIVDHDEVEAEKNNLPCWRAAYASGPARPQRHLCVICGFFANYKCRNCATRRIEAINSYYCSLRCLEVHNETNCGKAVHLAQW
ncbi:uncharacterized protein TA08650 [Theileria annulata]|uniref:Protein SEY1 homolog n=1 Tax=Theileria annulata TaxID=5874 RepID=SEY1_THEAN|nr:uncharacterized protein TA08650 [Theileria annulata]Q4U9I8.1 RecName: Full=Protein SEY1 homolog [Theileria annulata]CAI76515.1 hypothetical protein, conserved [Theileria annulata]|eukprot:XP_953140.1 hypothetical protein, conserved [Theileria annulata]